MGGMPIRQQWRERRSYRTSGRRETRHGKAASEDKTAEPLDSKDQTVRSDCLSWPVSSLRPKLRQNAHHGGRSGSPAVDQSCDTSVMNLRKSFVVPAVRGLFTKWHTFCFTDGRAWTFFSSDASCSRAVVMRSLLIQPWHCSLIASPNSALALLSSSLSWSGRGSRLALEPELPDGDPLERRPPNLPDYPTDVPAPEPHDVPAWEPVDDPPPDTGEPEPKPRPIP
jgi:hypothetical protein